MKNLKRPNEALQRRKALKLYLNFDEIKRVNELTRRTKESKSTMLRRLLNVALDAYSRTLDDLEEMIR